ncbi:MAG: 50S ribosomal protein L11 [Candidatus Riflebacteria bacterium RBG_13_59_9]|nr:MAG: 50S ribosomal protein L11 [Candidatus Riflebacteria bacterium RBG_13_59_9]
MARKEIAKIIKVHLKGGAASPAPPLGPSLSAAGIQVMEFCRTFNDATRERAGETLPTEIIVYKDKTWVYNIKTSLTSDLVKKELGLEKASAEPNRVRVGELSREALERVARIKLPDLNTKDLEAAMKIVAGTCRQMGVNVEGYYWEIAKGPTRAMIDAAEKAAASEKVSEATQEEPESAGGDRE